MAKDGIGRPLKEFCKYGHKLSETRVFEATGRTRCSICLPERSERLRKSDPEKAKRYAREQSWKKIGLTEDMYEDAAHKQKYKCAICGLKVSGRLHVDHCHETNKFRGLLCQPCNMALGLLKDNLDTISAAYEYLFKSKENYAN